MALPTQQIGRKSLLKLLVSLSLSFFSLISMTLLKRSPNFGYEAVGVLSFAFSYVAIFQIIGDLGFGKAHSQLSNDKNLSREKCNGTFVTIKLFLTLMMVSVICLSILISKYFFDYEFQSEILKLVIYLYIVKIFFDNIISIFKNIFSARIEVAKVLVPTFFARFCLMSVKAIIIIYTSYSLTYIVGAEIITSLFLLIIFVYYSKDYGFTKIDWIYAKKYSSLAFPLIFIGLVAALNENFDKLMLQYFKGSIEVGVYSIPQRITVFFLIIPTVVASLLFPLFSKEYSEKNFLKIQHLSNQATKYTSFIILPLSIFIYIFSDPLMILIFGSDAIKSAPVLRVLTFAIFLHTLSFPYSIQIVATGHAWLGVIISFISLIINISFNLILIPDYFFGFQMFGLGALGASFATFISLTIRALIIIFCVSRITKATMYINIWKHFLAGFILLYLGYFLLDYYLPLFLPLFLILMCSVHFLQLYILKELTLQDIKYIYNIAAPKKMLRYIRSELFQL